MNRTDLPRVLHRLPLAEPEAGQVTPVQPGVFWVRMPLPFALNHINLWLLEDELEGRQGWTIIDTGVGLPETQAHWRSVIDQVFQGRPLLRLICTHMHPDHMGLAAWLCEGLDEGRWQAPLLMTLGEYATGRMFVSKGMADEANAAPDAEFASSVLHFQRHGMQAPSDREKAEARKDHFTRLVPRLPVRYQRLLGGQTLQIGGKSWEIIPGYGHSPEHAALWCAERRLLISGDMVLPRISTNISVWAQEPDGDPLRLFLDSLRRFEPLPEDAQVLPSHGFPFGGRAEGGLHDRLAQLHEHHDNQIAVTRAFFSQGPRTVAELVPAMFPRELDLHQFSFAMGEALAHANHLWHAGLAERQFDGEVYRFESL